MILQHLTLHRYVEIAKLLIENGSKVDYREPTDELYPRTMLSDEPLRLSLKNRHYVSLIYLKKLKILKMYDVRYDLTGNGKITFRTWGRSE